MMNSELSLLTLWSYGLGALGYVALAMHLVHLLPQAPADRTRHILIAAAVLSALWAATGAGVSLLALPFLQPIHHAANALRYGAWFLLLTLLLLPSPSAAVAPALTRRPSRLMLMGGALVLADLVSQAYCLLHPYSRQTDTTANYLNLALVVFGIVLIEQLYRNTTEESQWNIKPLAVGLVAIFVFDMYY
jgi:hypothetical protein